MEKTKGDLVLIEDDEWGAALLAKFLRDAGYTVSVAGTAREGFDLVCQRLPDCVICDVELPDVDGFWVARRIRTETGDVSTTPFVFLTGTDEHSVRLQGLSVGADVYLTKPSRPAEVVAQVAALIGMARRLKNRDSYGPQSMPGPPAMRGDLAQMSVASLLTVLDMERRSGRLKVRTRAGDEDTVVALEIASGCIVSATIDEKDRPVMDALRLVLGWNVGRFWFRSGAAREAGDVPTIGALLVEAMRLEDEANR